MQSLAQFENNQPKQWFDKDYQTTVRQFKNGQSEVVTHVIRPMARIAVSERWLRFNPIAMKLPVPEIDESLLSTVEQAEIDAECLRKIEENRARSVRRARQKLRWLVKSCAADHMMTLSYRENMQDLSRLKRDWQAFVRLIHARYPSWQFVAVRETQDRGALHLHVAVVGRQNIKYLRRCWYIALGASPEATGIDTPGAVNMRGPSKRWGGIGYEWKADKLAGYMGKYLHKCFDQTEHHSKRYWQSKDIQLPEEQKIWLGAASFVDAIQQTHDIARACGIENLTMWASEGYSSIWMTG